MAEIVFILEPDTGRVTVESSNADAQTAKEISRDLGQGTVVNCARPKIEVSPTVDDQISIKTRNDPSGQIYLYQLYHHSTVDGPGRRSVIQFAGCSIRCSGCYVPETHLSENGKLVSITDIVAEVKKRSGEHDGVTILGGEPFDQTEGLEILVKEFKKQSFHLTIYTGFMLENLLARNSESVERILGATDLLIDGAFQKDLAKGAGEYRGSSNQRLLFYPMRGAEIMSGEKQKEIDIEDGNKKSEAEFIQFMAECLDEGWSPTRCPEGCPVEPDGICPHGYKSVALEYGFI